MKDWHLFLLLAAVFFMGLLSSYDFVTQTALGIASGTFFILAVLHHIGEP